MNADLSRIPNAYETRPGIPRLDWDAIDKWVEANIDESSYDQAYKQLARQWLDLVQRSLPDGYSIAESDEFYLLARVDSQTAERILDWCEVYRESILDVLDGVAAEVGFGKHVVLAFHDLDTYYDYVADFYPDEGEYAPTGGTFLDNGYGHIATSTVYQELHRTIAHELTHALVRHLPLPPWLNEGVTQLMTDLVTESSHFVIDRDLVRRHRTYWTPETIDAFWSGASFGFPDDGQELSYKLAELLVRNLFSDFSRRTFEFVRSADFSDAGDSACHEIFGVGLASRVAQFLGPGDWQPRYDYAPTEAEQGSAVDEESDATDH